MDILKKLLEQRNTLIEEMEGMVSKIETETRAFNEDEQKRMKDIKEEIRKIDKTIEELEDSEGIEKRSAKGANEGNKEETRSQDEIDNDELRGIFEKREAMNTASNEQGGAVVNSELAKEILKAIKDRSDVYNFFDNTGVKGNLKIPKKTSSGKATWEDETLKPNSTDKGTVPNLELIELGQNRLYRESALTQQMLNSQELDLKAFVLDDISETMTDAIEDAIFNGDGNKKPTGIISSIPPNKKISLATRGALTVEDLKKCKAKLKKNAQKGAKWFMNSETYLEIDLLKDSTGRALLQPDVTKGSGYILLGLPIEVTDVMATTSDTGAKCLIVLANKKAYHTNTQKQVSLYVYDDSTYTRAGLVGYASDIYMDGKAKDVKNYVAGIFNKAAA